MDCKTCRWQSGTCGNFPTLSNWKGNWFPCWEPRYWVIETPTKSGVAGKGKFPIAFLDPNITDAFAEKKGGRNLIEEDRDCLFCNYFDEGNKTCPVCPKNDDRNYAKRCVSFGPKKKEE